LMTRVEGAEAVFFRSLFDDLLPFFQQCAKSLA